MNEAKDGVTQGYPGRSMETFASKKISNALVSMASQKGGWARITKGSSPALVTNVSDDGGPAFPNLWPYVSTCGTC